MNWMVFVRTHMSRVDLIPDAADTRYVGRQLDRGLLDRQASGIIAAVQGHVGPLHAVKLAHRCMDGVEHACTRKRMESM